MFSNQEFYLLGVEVYSLPANQVLISRTCRFYVSIMFPLTVVVVAVEVVL